MIRTKIMLLGFSIAICSLLGMKSITQDNAVPWKNGDVVFQDSPSDQATAIKIATNSEFSHCGIVFSDSNKWFVLEAVQPVRIIPINQWIMQGNDGFYEVKRLKDQSALTSEKLALMRKIGRSFINKNYDIQFSWTDDRMYCSELVWKIYKRGAGIELGTPKPLKSYNLSHPIVKQKLEERYGTKIPLDTKMISPQDIYESSLLE